MIVTKRTKMLLLNSLYMKYPHCNSIPLESLIGKNIVYGEGDPDAKIMIVGEAPGQKEDELARPFVGRSGQLLTNTLRDASLSRDAVFITNVVKCRPPNNRAPSLHEIELYKKHLLLPEIKIIDPKIILTLGATATKALLGEKIAPISKIRGTLQIVDDLAIIPTFHPAYILRNPDALKIFRHDIEFAKVLAYKEK